LSRPFEPEHFVRAAIERLRVTDEDQLPDDVQKMRTCSGLMPNNFKSADPVNFAAIARFEESIVGYAWAYPTEQRLLWIYEIYVDPAHRCSGIGRLLMEELVDLASSLSLRGVEGQPSTHGEVEARHRFFRRCGFSASQDGRWTLDLA
jgi:GNAT superfamily N-acetyltransferase